MTKICVPQSALTNDYFKRRGLYYIFHHISRISDRWCNKNRILYVVDELDTDACFSEISVKIYYRIHVNY